MATAARIKGTGYEPGCEHVRYRAWEDKATRVRWVGTWDGNIIPKSYTENTTQVFSRMLIRELEEYPQTEGRSLD